MLRAARSAPSEARRPIAATRRKARAGAFARAQNEGELNLPREMAGAKSSAAPAQGPKLEYIDVSHRGYTHVKRAMDFCIAAVALIVLAIPLALILLCTCIDDPGNPIFTQKRIGRGGKPFRIYKIRTMKVTAPGNLSAAEFRNASKYITRIGGFLRSSSLDELPQLLNVLKGDMSLIGPRPLILAENRIHKLRTRYGVYQLRPGITGLAQINGRNNISVREKVGWEVEYMRRYGLACDLKILFGSIPKILRGTDVVAENREYPPA